MLPFVAMLSASGVAHADHLLDWGTETTAFTASCPSFCTSFNFGPTDGGTGTLSAATSQDDSRGDSQSSAVLSAASGISTPVLRAQAFSTGPAPTNNSAGAEAYGVEGYTYEGSVPKLLVVDINLTGDLFDPSDESVNDITARVIACGADNFVFGLNGCDFGEVLPFSEVLDQDFLVIEQSESGAVRTGQLSFTVAPGESFYLRGSVDATATRDGASADSFSTLTMTFQDSSDLVTASSGDTHIDPPVASVPSLAPLAVVMLLFALGGFATTRVRHGA